VQSILAGRNRVRGDGRVDVPGATYTWLQASNAPRWQMMPAGSPGEGFHNFELTDTRDQHDYGTSWLAEVIRAAAAHYRDHHLRAHPTAALLTTNNVSLPRGGDTPKHSGHETGLACDLRLPRKDGRAGGIDYTDTASYDQEAARAMLQALRAQALVSKVYFNDGLLISEGLCRYLDDHHDHIHFQIRPPARGAPDSTAPAPPVSSTEPPPSPPTPAPTAPTAPTAPSPRPTTPTASDPPVAPATAFRSWFITAYHVAIEPASSTEPQVPILSRSGDVIAQVPAGFFAEMALQGSGRLKDGRLLSGDGWRAPEAHDYAPVLAVHRRRYPAGNKYQDRPKVSGIATEGDNITKVRAYVVTPPAKEGLGYGVLRGIPLEPYKTVAADIGAFESSDERYRGAWSEKKKARVVVAGKTGLVPTGTRVYIRQLDGMTLPDGARHDGWVVVNDTGGAIYGAHFDIFVGARENGPPLLRLARDGKFMDVWFEGIEERVPADYSYGFPKKRGGRNQG
jgi:3D (Asp-Asp-Asp) domain-containing protein